MDGREIVFDKSSLALISNSSSVWSFTVSRFSISFRGFGLEARIWTCLPRFECHGFTGLALTYILLKTELLS